MIFVSHEVELAPLVSIRTTLFQFPSSRGGAQRRGGFAGCLVAGAKLKYAQNSE